MTTATPIRRSLGEVVEVVSGAVPAKPTDEQIAEPFVGITEISAGGAAAPRRVAVEDVPPGAPRLALGDVAIALMSNIGSALFVTPRHEGAVLGRECVMLRPRVAEITGAWLYVWTQSEDFAQQVERHVTGTTMPRLSRRALSDFALPLPELDTQIEAERILADFDAALAKAGQVVANLTELRRIELQLLIGEVGAAR